MRNFIIGLITGLLLAGSVAIASDISGEALWNLCFNSTLNTIKVVGI